MLSGNMAISDSPTAQAIAAYEEYARAHLPRLVEEALETSVAEQTQPIEESLRRALAGIVRDCHTRLAQNFLQHRSSNLDDTRAQIESLPSFYIEPLNLTDENSLPKSDYGTSRGQGLVASQIDSGYATVDPVLGGHSGDVFGDWCSFFGTDDGTSIPFDWAATLGSGEADYVGKNCPNTEPLQTGNC